MTTSVVLLDPQESLPGGARVLHAYRNGVRLVELAGPDRPVDDEKIVAPAVEGPVGGPRLPAEPAAVDWARRLVTELAGESAASAGEAAMDEASDEWWSAPPYADLGSHPTEAGPDTGPVAALLAATGGPAGGQVQDVVVAPLADGLHTIGRAGPAVRPEPAAVVAIGAGSRFGHRELARLRRVAFLGELHLVSCRPDRRSGRSASASSSAPATAGDDRIELPDHRSGRPVIHSGPVRVADPAAVELDAAPAAAPIDRLRERGSPVDAAIADSHPPGAGPVRCSTPRRRLFRRGPGGR